MLIADLIEIEDTNKVDQPTPELSMASPPDWRLKSELFRQKVRRVMEYLGIENNQGNFRQWNGLLDWDAIDKSIEHPTKLALCHVLDGRGQKVACDGRLVVVAREIAACSESEASEILAKESKVFVKWWEPTRFDCGEAVMAELRKELSNGN